MIKCKVTKRIMTDGNTFMGFNITISQIICAAVAAVASIASIILLKDILDINTVLWIVFGEIVLCVLFGIKIQGQSLIALFFKPAISKRPYNSKGVFDNEPN